MFPDVPGELGAGLSSGAFLSCSADNTIRLWHMNDWTQTHAQNILSSVSWASNSICLHLVLKKMLTFQKHLLSLRWIISLSTISLQDLLNIIYIDGNTGALLDPECTTNANVDKPGDGQTAESRTGIRTICVSPDGKHLASGDRNGMLR